MLKTDNRCGNCMFHMHEVNVCRAGPPTPILIGVQQGIASPKPVIGSYFPPMTDDGWCGHHEREDERQAGHG